MNRRSTLLLETPSEGTEAAQLPQGVREDGRVVRGRGRGPSPILAQAGGIGARRPATSAWWSGASRAARFPAVKSLDNFDFPAIPSMNKALAMELARCEYIQRQDNVIAIGNQSRSVRPAHGWACCRPIFKCLIIAVIRHLWRPRSCCHYHEFTLPLIGRFLAGPGGLLRSTTGGWEGGSGEFVKGESLLSAKRSPAKN